MTDLGFRVMRDYKRNILKAPIYAPRIVPSMHFFVPYRAQREASIKSADCRKP